jgi:hypothetical protein
LDSGVIVGEIFEINLRKRWGERGEKENDVTLAPAEQIGTYFGSGALAAASSAFDSGALAAGSAPPLPRPPFPFFDFESSVGATRH